MAEMVTDLLNAIYNRIAQLGQAIQSLNNSLDGLNQSIEQRISNLNSRIADLSNEISIAQSKHVDVLKEIGTGFITELKTIKKGLALDSFQNIISNLEKFEKLASEVLNQEVVNVLLSEALDSIKKLKESPKIEEVTSSD